jgi:hypothetical protein
MRKKAKAKRTPVDKRVATLEGVVVPRGRQVASDVWLEIGPIWMERNPTLDDELTIRESLSRRMKQT